jgi:branched-chain amino acid transport system substrate-binding protein
MSVLNNKPAVVGLIFVFLFVGMGVGYFGLQAVAPMNPGLSGSQQIVFLAPLTGELADYAQNSKVAAEFAVTQVNNWLAHNMSESWSLTLTTVDTGLDPNQALTKMQTFAGVQFFMGPMSSAEVKGVKQYADSNKLLVISPSSTSPAIALPNDYVLRYCPSDAYQGLALARLLNTANVTNVVITWRGDSWGDGLENATATSFQALGGTVKESVRYDPTTSDFTTAASTLASDVSAVQGGGVALKNIGVLSISFAEIVGYMTAADSKSVLKQVNWFGSDGDVNLPGILTDPTAGPFAKHANFTCSQASPQESPYFDQVRNHVNATLGRVPDSYAYFSYDVIWTLALGLEQVKSYSAEKVKGVLPSVIEHYYGASGAFTLNANGDRAPGNYDLWTVLGSGSTQVWTKTGLWHGVLDTITWTTNPYV